MRHVTRAVAGAAALIGLLAAAAPAMAADREPGSRVVAVDGVAKDDADLARRDPRRGAGGGQRPRGG